MKRKLSICAVKVIEKIELLPRPRDKTEEAVHNDPLCPGTHHPWEGDVREGRGGVTFQLLSEFGQTCREVCLVVSLLDSSVNTWDKTRTDWTNIFLHFLWREVLLGFGEKSGGVIEHNIPSVYISAEAKFLFWESQTKLATCSVPLSLEQFGSEIPVCFCHLVVRPKTAPCFCSRPSK